MPPRKYLKAGVRQSAVEIGRLRGVSSVIFLALLLSISLSFAQSPPVCQPPGTATVLTLNYDHPAGQPTGTLTTYLYYMSSGITTGGGTSGSQTAPASPSTIWNLADAAPAPHRQSGAGAQLQTPVNIVPVQLQPQGLPGALLLVIDSSPSSPQSVCRIITDAKGKASAPLPQPTGGACVQHRVVFCPFTGSDAQSKADLATCAQLIDANNKLIPSVDWHSISPCANSVGGTDADVKDYRDKFLPVQNAQQVCNTSPSSSSVGLCWSLALIFGLLFSAAFLSGRNPLAFFDFGVTRGVRANRAAGAYTPMTQNVSMNISGIAQAADKLANAASDLVSGKGISQGSFSQGLLGKTLTGDRSATATSEEQKGLVGKGLEKITPKLDTGSKPVDKALTGAIQAVAIGTTVGLVSLVAGRKPTLKKFLAAGISTAKPYGIKAAAGYGMDTASEALAKGAEALMPATAPSTSTLASIAGVPKPDLIDNFRSGLATTLDMRKKELSLPQAGPDGVIRVFRAGEEHKRGAEPLGTLKITGGLTFTTYTDSSNRNWVATLSKNDEGKWELSDRFRWITESAGGGMTMILANGRQMSMNGGSGTKSYAATVGDAAVGLFSSGNLGDVAKAVFVTPFAGLYHAIVNTFSSNGLEIRNASREFALGDGTGKPDMSFIIRGGQVLQLSGKTSTQVRTYDAGTGELKLNADITDAKGKVLLPASRQETDSVTGKVNTIQIVYGFDGLVMADRTHAAETPVSIPDRVASSTIVPIAVGGVGLHYVTTTKDDKRTQTISDAHDAELVKITRDRNGAILSITNNEGKNVDVLSIGNLNYSISKSPDGVISIDQTGRISQAQMAVDPWKAEYFYKNGAQITTVDEKGHVVRELTAGQVLDLTTYQPIKESISALLLGLYSSGAFGGAKAEWRNPTAGQGGAWAAISGGLWEGFISPVVLNPLSQGQPPQMSTEMEEARLKAAKEIAQYEHDADANPAGSVIDKKKKKNPLYSSDDYWAELGEDVAGLIKPGASAPSPPDPRTTSGSQLLDWGAEHADQLTPKGRKVLDKMIGLAQYEQQDALLQLTNGNWLSETGLWDSSPDLRGFTNELLTAKGEEVAARKSLLHSLDSAREQLESKAHVVDDSTRQALDSRRQTIAKASQTAAVYKAAGSALVLIDNADLSSDIIVSAREQVKTLVKGYKDADADQPLFIIPLARQPSTPAIVQGQPLNSPDGQTQIVVQEILPPQPDEPKGRIVFRDAAGQTYVAERTNMGMQISESKKTDIRARLHQLQSAAEQLPFARPKNGLTTAEVMEEQLRQAIAKAEKR